jgi:hypothetical protein
VEKDPSKNPEIFSIQDIQAENPPVVSEAVPQRKPTSTAGRGADFVSGMLGNKNTQEPAASQRASDGIYSIQDMEAEGLKPKSAEPTTAEAAKAVGMGAVKGAAETAAMAAPAYMGFKIGTGLMPLAGPFAPFMPALGLAAGAAYGMYASDTIEKMFPHVEREDAKKYYEGGRTFAGGLAFSPLVFTFSKAPQAAGIVRQTIGAIGDFARANPGKFMAAETLANFYAGLAGGTATALAPDSPLTKLGAEVSASFAPTRFVFGITDALGSAIKNIKKADTPGFSDATKNYVQNQLIEIAEAGGEDPKKIVQEIDKVLKELPLDTSGVPRPGTVAQATGSVVLTKLQSYLARGNAKYSGDTKEMGEEALKAYSDIIKKFEGTGDPSLLAAAAILRKDNLQKQFQTGFNLAQSEALEQAARLGTKGSDNRAQVGDILQNKMEALLRIARESESKLWQDAMRATFRTTAGGKLKPVKVPASNFAQALFEVSGSPFSSASKGEIASEFASMSTDLSSIGFNAKKLKALNKIPVTEDYLETRRLDPGAIEALDLKPASAVDLIRFRSSLLEKAREAGGAGRTAAARRYSVLADSILDDLDTLPGTQYADARAFSRELNDAFTRTFAGKVTSTTRQGADVFAPEVLVQRAFSGGADSTLQRIREMQEAANFVDPTGEAAKSVRAAEQKVIRSVAAETLNEDGTVNLNALNTFRAKNADALRFLGMEDEFKDIASTQKALLEFKDPNSLVSKRIADEKAFASLLEVDDPTTAVSMALTSKTAPTRNFKSLVETADAGKDPEAARRGLLSSIYQYAFQTASKGEAFSPQVLEDIFFKPLSPNNPSLANMMRSTNLVSAEEISRLKQLTNKMSKVESALNTQQRIVDPNIVVKPQDAIEDLAITMLGAKFAGAIGPGGAGSLGFASRTMQMTRNFFNGMPQRQRLLLLEEATKDLSLYKELMTRALTEQQSRDLGVSVLRHLYSPTALPTAIDRYLQTIYELPPEQPAAPAPSQSQQMLRRLPPAPQTRGMPNMAPAAPPAAPAQGSQGAPAPGPQSAAPQPPSQSRQMLSALFPEDRLLAMPGAQ